jgi:hypothetical protein
MDRSMSVRPKLFNPTFFTVVAMKSIEDGLLQYFFYLERIGPNRLYSVRKKDNQSTLCPIAK